MGRKFIGDIVGDAAKSIEERIAAASSFSD
jgi:hypothetical protein